MDWANGYVWSFPKTLPLLVAILLGTGLYVTARLLFIQLRRTPHAIAVVMGKFDDPNDPGDVNHFQALSTALSATVGIGNIAGVALAIHYGGPGAVFWMWVTAFFGMALKFSECTLSLHYRDFDSQGHAAGGPMYYIEKGLGRRWKPLAIFFAVCAVICSFGSGNMAQANTVALSAQSDFGLAPLLVGIVSAFLVGVVILGGIKSVAKVASALAPSMALLYMAAALLILFLNAPDVPEAFATIFREAFNPTAGASGALAGGFMTTLLWGVKRGLFSNEAGQGSAPIAHAAAKTNEPVREGAVAMLGPLIDTLLICTMTALVIVTTGVWNQRKNATIPVNSAVSVVALEGTPLTVEVVNGDVTGAGVKFHFNDGVVDGAVLLDKDGQRYTGSLQLSKSGDEIGVNTGGLSLRGDMLQNSSALTSWAFKKGLSPLGDWGGLVVTFSVFLFAMSTMISWSYYGDRCVTYLFGSKYVLPYRGLYIVFVFLGSILGLKVVWDFGDLALGLMTLPNLIAVLLLMPKVVELSKDYFARMDAIKKDDKS